MPNSFCTAVLNEPSALNAESVVRDFQLSLLSQAAFHCAVSLAGGHWVDGGSVVLNAASDARLTTVRFREGRRNRARCSVSGTLHPRTSRANR